MNYYDDELERGRDGRDGRREVPRRPAAGQTPGGNREQTNAQTPARRTERPSGFNQSQGNVRRPASGQASSRIPEGTRRQAAGAQDIYGARGAGTFGQSVRGTSGQSVRGTSSQPVRGTSGQPVRGTSSQPVRGTSGQPVRGTSIQPQSGVRGQSQGNVRSQAQTGGRNPMPPGSQQRQAGRVSGGTGINGASANGNVGNGQGNLGHKNSSGGRVTATSKAAKQQAKKTAKNRKKRRLITLAVAECVALVFIFTYAFFARKWSLIVQSSDWDEKEVTNPVFSVEVPEYMKGHWTFAVFGVDSRDKNVLKGTNSDVIMICDVNQDTGEIKLVSVFRDTYLNLDDKGTYNKINQAYFTGGPTQAVKALNKNLDLNITDYVTFNWNAVANGINALGGIDMNISKAEFYYINSFITETVKGTGIGSHQLTHAGENHLDGVQAVAYGRLRLMDTDYARTERQRKVIEAAFNKALKADWNTLNSVVGAVLPQVSTCIDINDVFGMMKNITKYHIGDTMGFPAARGEASIPKKGACVIPQTLESNVIALHEFLFGEEGYEPSKTVKEISAKIASDTGMYKAGTAINHVSTDNGVIPSSKAPAKTTEESDEEESSKPVFETDEEGNFYDEEGNLVDEEGRRIDEYGFLIDEQGRRIDEEGNLLDEPGETDVDGNPIIDGEYTDEWGRPIAPTAPGESASQGRPGWPTRPVRPGESTSPSSPSDSYPGETTTPGSPGAEAPTESIGPGTGLEPGGSQNPGGAIIPGGSENSGGPGENGEPGAPTSGSTPSSGGSAGPGEAPGSPISGPGENATVTPAPTENYDNIGPGM